MKKVGRPANSLAISSIAGTSLKEREKYLEKLLSEVRQQNVSLKTEVEQLEDERGNYEPVNDRKVATQLENLGDDKKKLERELEAVEHRIKHILAQNDDIEKEIISYDLRTKKVLEARSKKLEWEKERKQELERAHAENTQRRIELLEKAKERDKQIEERRGMHAKDTETVVAESREEKQISEQLKNMLAEYEKEMKEHRKLQAERDLKAHKMDSTYGERRKREERKKNMEGQVVMEAKQIETLNEKLEKMKKLEEKIIVEKKASLSTKGVLKSQFQDILNKKLDEKEIKDMLTQRTERERISITRNKSLTQVIEEEERKEHEKKGFEKTKFVGGNTGSYTQQRVDSRDPLKISPISARLNTSSGILAKRNTVATVNSGSKTGRDTSTSDGAKQNDVSKTSASTSKPSTVGQKRPSISGISGKVTLTPKTPVSKKTDEPKQLSDAKDDKKTPPTAKQSTSASRTPISGAKNTPTTPKVTATSTKTPISTPKTNPITKQADPKQSPTTKQPELKSKSPTKQPEPKPIPQKSKEVIGEAVNRIVNSNFSKKHDAANAEAAPPTPKDQNARYPQLTTIPVNKAEEAVNEPVLTEDIPPPSPLNIHPIPHVVPQAKSNVKEEANVSHPPVNPVESEKKADTSEPVAQTPVVADQPTEAPKIEATPTAEETTSQAQPTHSEEPAIIKEATPQADVQHTPESVHQDTTHAEPEKSPETLIQEVKIEKTPKVETSKEETPVEGTKQETPVEAPKDPAPEVEQKPAERSEKAESRRSSIIPKDDEEFNFDDAVEPSTTTIEKPHEETVVVEQKSQEKVIVEEEKPQEKVIEKEEKPQEKVIEKEEKPQEKVTVDEEKPEPAPQETVKVEEDKTEVVPNVDHVETEVPAEQIPVQEVPLEETPSEDKPNDSQLTEAQTLPEENKPSEETVGEATKAEDKIDDMLEMMDDDEDINAQARSRKGTETFD